MLRVAQFYNKNQFIYDDDNKAIFQSYDSVIAIYNKKTLSLKLGKDWDYNNTTRKHLLLFIHDFCRYYPYDTILYASNKRKAIKKMIDDKIIKYDSRLA